MSLIRLNFNFQGWCCVLMEAGAKHIDLIELYHSSEWRFELENSFYRKEGEPILGFFNRTVKAAQDIRTAHWRKHAHKAEPIPEQPVWLALVDTEKRKRDLARELSEMAEACDISGDDFVRFASAIEIAQREGMIGLSGHHEIYAHMELAFDGSVSPPQRLTPAVREETFKFAKRVAETGAIE